MKSFCVPFLWLMGAAAACQVLCLSAQAAPTITRLPYIQNTTATSVYIVWNTDQLSDSKVGCYRMDDKAWETVSVSEKVLHHVVRIDGLRPATSYGYAVRSGGVVLARATFQTNKLPGQHYTIAIWGDSGYGDNAQYRLAKKIDEARPDLMLHTGDLIYEKGEAKDFDPKFFRVYAPTLERAPFYGCLGNHDVLTMHGGPFLDNFVVPHNGPANLPPGSNYSFDYADAHIVILNANLTQERMERDLAPWLEHDLAGSTAKWKFAVFHQPVYSSGMHGDELRCKRVLAPIFSRCHVDVVFNGHDHDYERFKPQNGVVYIVTGAGGATRYFRKQFRDITAKYWNADWSFTRIDIAGNTLHGRQIATSGEVVDDWSITKP